MIMCAKKSTSQVDVYADPRPFDFRNYSRRLFGSSPEFRSGFVPPVAPCVPADGELISGVLPLTEQIRKMQSGGLPLSVRELSESNYDEVDSTEVDPTVDRSVDRLERSELIAQRISERMRDSHSEELDHADV